MLSILSSNAAMYIDPASTTTIIQIGAAVIITLSTFIGIFWSKIKRVFKKKEKEIEALDASEVNNLHDGEKDVITAADLMDDDN